MIKTAEKQPSQYDKLWTSVYGDIQRLGPGHFHARRIVKRMLAGLDYQSVLDVGSGPGWNIAMLSEGRTLATVVGVDISDAAIEHSRRSSVPGQFFVHDIQQSPVPGRYDLVHCALVVHLIPDDVKALCNLRESTGKYLLISTMTGDYERYKPWETLVGAIRNYRPGELEEKLVRTGFHIRRAISWGFPFYSPVTRWLQNFSSVGTARYGPGTRLLSHALRGLYYLNSSKRGDLLTVLATV